MYRKVVYSDEKIFALLFVFALWGCIPIFHRHTQVIDLKEFHKLNPDAKVFYDGEEQTDQVELFRSWFDKELVIKQDGFEDYHVQLESTGGSFTRSLLDEKPVFPAGTGCTGSIMIIGLFTDSPVVVGLGALLFPVGVIVDVATGIVTVPLSLLVNPWKHYEGQAIGFNSRYDRSFIRTDQILTPTDELKKSCNKKGYFISNLGCTECAYKEKVVATKEESDKCDNRFYDGKSKVSYSCDDTTDRIKADDCGKCKNRKKFDDYCVLNCPKDNPLQDQHGDCYACDEDRRIKTNDCGKCKNRRMSGEYCMLNCPADKPLQDEDGRCYSCDKEIRIKTNDCGKCKNRRMSGEYCIVNCPADKPLQDEYGRCYACDEKYRVRTQDCGKCPNRYDTGDGFCRLCKGTVSENGKECIE